MVVGKSITRHAPSASIGWWGDWGMAASSEGNDFVHLVESAVKKTDPDAAFCICQVAEWERDFARGESILPRLLAAREFDADLIVLRFVENVRHDSSFESRVFLSELDRLVKYLNKSQRAKIIVTTGFWHHPADSELRKYALWHSYPLVELGDLGEEEKYKAIGLFEHTGVANHPSDKGHAAIAERIVDAIKELK